MQRYAITPGTLISPKGDAAKRLVDRCSELAQEGVEFLLLREKQLSPPELATLLGQVVAAVGNLPTKILLAGWPEIALAAGADGVHLSDKPGGMSPKQVRRIFAGAWVSLACHTVQQVASQDADAILFSPVFGKTVGGVEVVAGVGVGELRRACVAAGETPVFALGSVTGENAEACVAVGASGVAGIRLFFS